MLHRTARKGMQEAATGEKHGALYPEGHVEPAAPNRTPAAAAKRREIEAEAQP
jgi:hypothetical protein